jgi:hypothetical protein
MSNLPVDRDPEYMKEMWGTTKLITDYGSMMKIEELEAKPFTCGGSHFTHGHGFFKERVQSSEKLKSQSELHEKIRNDEDYDDWEYGTEPCYGKKW